MTAMWFGHYRLDRVLGEGAMGKVYCAFDHRDQRRVALKMMTPALAEDPGFRARFRREAKILARIREPHVIPIYGHGSLNWPPGSPDMRPYISMRFVDGPDLKELVDDGGPMEPVRAVSILTQVAGALDAVHRAGLVHRDVKMSNIMVSGEPGREFAYLIDFGIAYGAEITRLSVNGDLPGTLPYMAPELFAGPDSADGEPVFPAPSPSVDVYALACVLFGMLTGRLPFVREFPGQIIWAHLNTPPPRLSALRPGLPPELDEVLARGMAKTAGQRYSSAGELAAAARYAVGLPVPPARRLGGRRLRRVLVGVVTAVALTVGGAAVVAALPDTPCSRPGVLTPDRPLSVSTNVAVATPSDVVVSPDGCRAYVTSADQDTVAVLDTRTGAVSPVTVDEGPASVAVAPDGSRAYVLSRDSGVLSVLDAGNTVVATVPLGPGASDVTAAPDERRIYVTDRDDDTVRAVDTDRNVVVATVRVGSGPRAVAVTPDGRQTYVTNGDDGTVSVIDTATQAVTGTIPVGAGPDSLAVSPDGRRVFVGNNGDGTVSVIDTAAREVTATTRVVSRAGAAVTLAVSPDGGRVYLASEQLVSVLDTGTNAVVRTLAIGEEATGVAVSPDGRQVYLASAAANSLSVIDTGVE